MKYRRKVFRSSLPVLLPAGGAVKRRLFYLLHRERSPGRRPLILHIPLWLRPAAPSDFPFETCVRSPFRISRRNQCPLVLGTAHSQSRRFLPIPLRVLR